MDIKGFRSSALGRLVSVSSRALSQRPFWRYTNHHDHFTACIDSEAGWQWSIQEHIGHLADLEELGERRLADFQARAEVLTAADMSNRKTEDARHNEANVWTPMQNFMEARAELVAKLEALPADVIAHVALHPRLQRPMNVVEWMFFMCEHDDHHLAKMRAQAIELTAEIWDEVFG